jgi:uncharacterized protein YcsI (UPF0317 family)
MRTRPTAAEVRAYREEHECSLQEAIAAVSKQWRRDYVSFLRAKVGEVNCVRDCEHAMAAIVDLLEVLVERS